MKGQVLRALELGLILLSFPVLWLAFLAACLLVLPPALLVRLIVSGLAKALHPDWDGMMSDYDTVVGADRATVRPQCVILVYNVVEGDLDLDRFRRRMHEDLVMYRDPRTGRRWNKKMTQYTEQWLGYNFWKTDPDFRIENHVGIMPGTEGNELTTEEEFLGLVGQLMTKPYVPKRSYWECLLVKNYLPKAGGKGTRTMVVFRLHHGIGDGFSFLKQILQHIYCDKLDKVMQVRSGGPRPSLSRQALSLAYYLVTMPYQFVRQELDIDSNPWFLRKSELRRESNVGMTRRIPVQDIKEIYREYGVSFGAVLYSAVAGSFRKMFQRKFAGQNVPVPELTRCFTPFPWKNHPNNKLVNHWTCAVVKLFPGTECPLERMLKTEEELNKLKTSPNPLTNRLTLPLVAVLPVPLVRLIGSNWTSTSILSNFPGPTQPVSYYGGQHEVEDSCFWAPHLSGSAGIGITMMSYADSIRLGLNFDKAILPDRRDVEEMCLMIEEEFSHLLSLIRSKRMTEEKFGSEKCDDNDNEVSVNRRNLNIRHRSVS